MRYIHWKSYGKNMFLNRNYILIKTISWRIIGTLDTILLSWIVTGETTIALTIGGVELFTKMMLYYIHEKIWVKIK